MVYGSLEIPMTFTETIPLKSELAHSYEETISVFGNIEITCFDETISIISPIKVDYHDEPFIPIIAKIEKAIIVIGETMVKGVVTPIKKFLEELRRRIEEITADDKEELKRRIEEMEEED